MKDVFMISLDRGLDKQEKVTSKMKDELFDAFWKLEGARLEAETLLDQHSKKKIHLTNTELRDCVMRVYGEDNLLAMEKMNQFGVKNKRKTQ